MRDWEEQQFAQNVRKEKSIPGQRQPLLLHVLRDIQVKGCKGCPRVPRNPEDSWPRRP